MSNKKIRKFLKKNQPNSGFTLTELLTGLFMSAFVTGALGFGLIQILRTTSSEQAKSSARRDTSRAIEFISDEVRRARTIEPDASNANLPGTPGPIPAGSTIVLALDIPEISDDADTVNNLGVDADVATTERVVYYLTSNAGTNWQGPQVLFRYGPPLDANGNYTTANWGNEALIDGIDNNPIAASPCTGGDTLNPPLASNPSGFYTCLNDAASATSAQLFLTGGIDTIANNGTSNDDSYTAATQVVARAKNATVASALPTATTPIFFRSLGADFICDSTTGAPWTMRMDFANSAFSDPSVDTTVADASAGVDSSRTAANLNSSTMWIHDENRKPQPININESNDLTIFSVPVNSSGCGSRSENEPLTENSPLDSILENNFNLSHTIRFQETVTNRPAGTDTDFWKTFNGNNDDPSVSGNYNNPNVTGDGRVLVLKNGSRIEAGASIDTSSNQAAAPLYEGFDPDGPGGVAPKPTLGEFLAASVDENGNSYATLISGSIAGGDAVYEVNLNDDERIIAFEIGQTDNGFEGVDYDGDGDTEQHPGFDVTDNVVLVRSDVFEENHTP